MKLNKTNKLIYAALFVAMGVVLPILFHSVPNAGRVFLPMHIPVILSGFVVGPMYGLLCGILTPIMSHLFTGMPPMAILPSMLCELATYGFLTGLLYSKLKIKNDMQKIYLSLIFAMIGGRVMYGILNALIFSAGKYSLEMWLSAAFVVALPGIIIQLIVVPLLFVALKRIMVKSKG